MVRAAGTRKADPLNVVIVADGLSAAFPFVGRGWRFVQPLDLRTAAGSAAALLFDAQDPNLPVSPMWVFGRREDVALQKPRDTISQRNHLRLWLTPLRYQGQSVFVGQISRDIGVELTDKSWYLTTHKIDPDVDFDRDYLLQDLLLSGAVAQFGYVGGVGASMPADPRVNLDGRPVHHGWIAARDHPRTRQVTLLAARRSLTGIHRLAHRPTIERQPRTNALAPRASLKTVPPLDSETPDCD